LLQLTGLVSNGVNVTDAYSPTQNNGKIISQTDNLSGEQLVYTYDALNRLASAQATNNSWGQSYSYDGFGNLTDQNVIATGKRSHRLHRMGPRSLPGISETPRLGWTTR
jgi:YD repeat-containing protein